MTIRPSLIDCDDDKITLDDGSPRICAICGVTANLAEDSPQKRVYECPVGPRGGCGARETITKTEKAGWWYHGWKAA